MTGAIKGENFLFLHKNVPQVQSVCDGNLIISNLEELTVYMLM